jgi:hypothetical protein
MRVVPSAALPASATLNTPEYWYVWAIDGYNFARFNRFMTRCLSCNGILASGEKSCYGCGTAAVKITGNGGSRVAGLLTALFVGSLLLTVASCFSFLSDRTPPFAACLAASVVLLFVRRSADQFTKKS